MRRSARNSTLTALCSARLIVNFLSERKNSLPPIQQRAIISHIGAALADSILQAGLKYETVVSRRVTRILDNFPEAATITGTIEVLSEFGPNYFLSWSHPGKIVRFVELLCHLHDRNIESTVDLNEWLLKSSARNELLQLKGIGPKTVDYLASLVGHDCVAVDRHVHRLSQWVGIANCEYSELKLAVSYAADLMDIPRRQFDWWLWQVMSQPERDRRSSSAKFESQDGLPLLAQAEAATV